MKKNLLITSLLAVGMTLSYFAYSELAFSKCSGSKSCKACKNCKYCKHCAKDGGTCGVCK